MISDETPAPGAADTAGTPAFDTSVAHQARMYDYLLGRAVRYLAGEAGIRQFLDIGTGMDALPPGSYLAISHMASELLSQETRERLGHHSGAAMQQRRPVPGPSGAGTNDPGESVLSGAVGRER